MSLTSTQAFVHVGSWDENTRSHPATKWLEHYTCDYVDTQKFKTESAASTEHAKDWVLQKSTGEVVEDAEAAWKAVAEIYSPFSSFVHEPRFIVIWQTEKGWDLWGAASIWYNLAAPPSGGEQKVKGHGGKEWDGSTPGAFYFKTIQDGDDFKLVRTEIYSDPSKAMVQMLKRGMLKPEQLMG